MYSFDALPARTVAILAAGLREDSRIMLKVSGSRLAPGTLFSATMIDQLNTLIWMRTEDGTKGRNRPKSVVDALLQRESGSAVTAYGSAAEWEAAREKILKGGE